MHLSAKTDPEKKARKILLRTGATDRTDSSSGEPQRPKAVLKNDALQTLKLAPLAVSAEQMARRKNNLHGMQGKSRASAGLSSDKDWEGEPRRPEPLYVGQTNISGASGIVSTAVLASSETGGLPKLRAASCISIASSNAGWNGEVKRPESWKGEPKRPEPRNGEPKRPESWKGEAMRPEPPRKAAAPKPELKTSQSLKQQAEIRYQTKVGNLNKDGSKRKFVTMTSL
jgi:hypothetical protein